MNTKTVRILKLNSTEECFEKQYTNKFDLYDPKYIS